MDNKKYVRKEEISKIILNSGTVCYLIQEGLDFGDGLGLFDHEGIDYLGNPTRESKKTILDANFNRYINSIGFNMKAVENLIASYKAKGLDVFIGEGAPITRTHKLVFTENVNRADQKALWARPTDEQIEHYNSLLEKPKSLKKRV